jgi:hypothetical protein
MADSPQSQAVPRILTASPVPVESAARGHDGERTNEVKDGKAGAVSHVMLNSSGSAAVEETDDISTAPISTSKAIPTQDMPVQAKPRRFLPQPVEESSRTSRSRKHKVEEVDVGQMNLEDSVPAPSEDQKQSHDSRPRRFAPAPVETSTRSSKRRFAPEPVETSSRSSKDKVEDTKPRRRFAPQPVETSARSSKDKETQQDPSTKPRRRFAPEPIQTESFSRRRKPKPAESQEDAWAAEDGPAPSPPRDGEASSRSSSSGSRKFSPELIETAKGAFRQSHSPTKQKPSDPPLPSPEQEANDTLPPLQESRFSAAALAKREHENKRRGSLMVPDLPTIESDRESGDDSEAPSLTNSRSSAESEQQLQPTKPRRAMGDSYTDYVLRLAAQTSSSDEREMQEQAMAAYINERPHEPVAHFAFDDEEDTTIRVGHLSADKGVDLKTFRRSSQDDLDWEMQNMRRHHAQLEQAKRDFKHDTAGTSRFSAAALGMRHHLEQNKQRQIQDRLKAEKKKEEDELAKMRQAASPPMLGADIVFPFTVSPKMTRCDVDHAPRPRTADSDDESDEEGDQHMWNRSVKVKVKKDSGGQGLWGGFCVLEEKSQPTTPMRSGIQTPVGERGNPFDGAGRKTPGQRTPGRRKLLALTTTAAAGSQGVAGGEDAFTSQIDRKLKLERQIDEEFPDAVITQIYNYLSLGYPSLAWAFDAELSKISGISVEELRRDDGNGDAKGFIGVEKMDVGRLGEDGNDDEVEVEKKWNGDKKVLKADEVGKCRRWEALRVYVREWARQSPGFAEEGSRYGVGRGKTGGTGWGGGVGVRRGSWGN